MSVRRRARRRAHRRLRSIPSNSLPWWVIAAVVLVAVLVAASRILK